MTKSSAIGGCGGNLVHVEDLKVSGKMMETTVPPRACGGRMRIIAALTDEVPIRHYLKGVGLPADPPPIAPPRPPPQPELEFAV